MSRSRPLLLFASLATGVAIAWATKPCEAAFGLYSEVVLIEGDQLTGSGFAVDETTSNQLVSVADGVVHPLETLGGDGDLTFYGEGSAQADYQTLRTFASGSLSNSYYDPDYNFDAGTGEIPTNYTTQALARFNETLQYGGTAVGYNSRYQIRVTGQISGENAYTTVTLTHGTAPPQYWFFTEPGVIDAMLTSNSFVGSANQEFTLEVYSSFNADTEYLFDGDAIAGTASFGNTVELVGIDARDASGTLLPAGSLVGESGAVYTILAAVPEPCSAVLVLGAIASLAVSRR